MISLPRFTTHEQMANEKDDFMEEDRMSYWSIERNRNGILW